MTVQAHAPGTPDPIPQVVAWTMAVGGVSFVAGFAGPLLLSNANQGPLLGIFVTGPLGFLLGALGGALRVSNQSARLSSAVVAMVWALTFAYTWFAAELLHQMIYLLLPLYAFIMASTVYLLSSPVTLVQLPESLQRSCIVVVVTQLITVATTLYPPVIKPWWGTPGDPPPAPFPSFAFVLDHGFELSQRAPTFPQFVVNRPELVLEWAIVIAVAFVLSLVIRALPRRSAA
jgi:hypothetical protein